MLSLLFFSGLLCQQTAPPAHFPELPGWTCVPESTVYTSSNLWDLIDGAADLFLEYRFEDLHLARYTNGAGNEIRVELYRHATPNDAFGMYAAERSTEYSFVDLGTQGYRSEGIVNFLCAEFYVKLSTLDTAGSVTKAMLDAGALLAGRLGRACLWPEDLRRLPATGRITNSETYVRRGVLGYDFLTHGFSASYEGGARCLLIRAGSVPEAESMLQRYREAVKQAVTLRSDGGVEVQDPHHGTVFLRRLGSDLVGVYGTTSAAAGNALLDAAVKATAGR